MLTLRNLPELSMARKDSGMSPSIVNLLIILIEIITFGLYRAFSSSPYNGTMGVDCPVVFFMELGMDLISSSIFGAGRSDERSKHDLMYYNRFLKDCIWSSALSPGSIDYAVLKS